MHISKQKIPRVLEKLSINREVSDVPDEQQISEPCTDRRKPEKPNHHFLSHQQQSLGFRRRLGEGVSLVITTVLFSVCVKQSFPNEKK